MGLALWGMDTAFGPWSGPEVSELPRVLKLAAVVVAGIVMMVKHSVALAFSLGAIVAAVRFRTSLDDSKDAAGIFVVIGIAVFVIWAVNQKKGVGK